MARGLPAWKQGWKATSYSNVIVRINAILKHSIFEKQVYIRITTRKHCYIKSSCPVSFGISHFSLSSHKVLKITFLVPRATDFYVSPDTLTVWEERWKYVPICVETPHHRQKPRSLSGLFPESYPQGKGKLWDLEKLKKEYPHQKKLTHGMWQNEGNQRVSWKNMNTN